MKLIDVSGFGPDRPRHPRATGRHGPAGDSTHCAQCSRTTGSPILWPCPNARPHTETRSTP